MRLDGIYGQPWPLVANDLPALAVALDMPLRSDETQASFRAPVELLKAYSYDRVRRAHRIPSWIPDAAQPSAPADIAEEFARIHVELLARADDASTLTLREQIQLEGALAMLDLCELVDQEDGTADGLASGLAAVNPSNTVIPNDNHALGKLNYALTAAIESDRASHHYQ